MGFLVSPGHTPVPLPRAGPAPESRLVLGPLRPASVRQPAWVPLLGLSPRHLWSRLATSVHLMGDSVLLFGPGAPWTLCVVSSSRLSEPGQPSQPVALRTWPCAACPPARRTGCEDIAVPGVNVVEPGTWGTAVGQTPVFEGVHWPGGSSSVSPQRMRTCHGMARWPRRTGAAFRRGGEDREG